MAEYNKKNDISMIAIAVSVIAIIFLMLIPLPAFLLDIMMALNLMFSLFILLIVLFMDKPTEFSSFPSLLLLSTIFGLALNVSSTKLILTLGEKFDGKMIYAFSSFVIGSSGGTQGLVVGFVVFIILIAVQAFVITKGASRISEVSARFGLDFFNTKNMAIESEYNAGVITESEAKKKKEQLERATNFYGAMDGASKFVSGNVKVGIFITIINIVAGLIIGVSFRGENFIKAMQMYTRFTIGDGLLAQLPSLLISVATGLAVTRSTSSNSFGQDIKSQFSQDAKIYFIAAGTLLFMAVLPGFPTFVLLLLSLGFAVVGFQLRRTGEMKLFKEKEVENSKAADSKNAKQNSDDDIKAVPLPDDVSLQFGYGLIPLVDDTKGAELLERIKRIRREVALEIGLVMPKIRIRDDGGLAPDEYCITIQGDEIAVGKIRLGAYLAVNPGNVQDEVPGETTKDPAFGLPALWISEENRLLAERAGYTVIDPPSIIATHLTHIIKTHAADILTRQMVNDILDSVKKINPIVVEELQSNQKFSLGKLQKILQCLLAENISIRNTTAILETISDYCMVTDNLYFIAEKVRQRLGRQIVQQYITDDNVLYAFMVEAEFLQTVITNSLNDMNGPQPAIDVEMKKAWLLSLQTAFSNFNAQYTGTAVILVQDEARLLIKRLIQNELPLIPVLAINEIPKNISVMGLGYIGIKKDE